MPSVPPRLPLPAEPLAFPDPADASGFGVDADSPLKSSVLSKQLFVEAINSAANSTLLRRLELVCGWRAATFSISPLLKSNPP